LPEFVYNARSSYNWGFAFIKYGQQPEGTVFLYGIKPAIIAIILAAIYPLAEIYKNQTAGIHCGWSVVCY
jgi:chromate transport protein ChrA